MTFEQRQGVARVQARDVDMNVEFGVKVEHALRSHFGLVASNVFGSIDDLPLKVRQAHHVVVDDGQATNAGCSEVKQHGAAKSPSTDDGDSGRAQPCLSVSTDLFHPQVPRMANGVHAARWPLGVFSHAAPQATALHQWRPGIPFRPR